MSGGRLYTEAEIKRAEALLPTHTLEQVAAILGRSSGNTLSHALRQRGIQPSEIAKGRRDLRWERIKTLRQGRRSMAAIAEEVGLSQPHVCRLLQRRGGPVVSVVTLREKVLEAHAAGMAGVDIAEHLGCSLRSVRRYLPYDNGSPKPQALGPLQRRTVAELRKRRAATSRELADALVFHHGACNVNQCCRSLERRGLVEALAPEDRPGRYRHTQAHVWALTPDGMRAARKLDR